MALPPLATHRALPALRTQSQRSRKFDRSNTRTLEFRPMRRTLLLVLLTAAFPLIAQQPIRPAITGIAFARFYTTDAPAAQKFYGDTLGFQRKNDNGVWIYPLNHAQWIALITSAPQSTARLAAVAFTTSDADQLMRYLEAHAVKPDLPLQDGEFGRRDPQGSIVLFVQ